MKNIYCKKCLEKIATIDRFLNVIHENDAARTDNSFSVASNTIEEVTLTCKCGHVTTLYGG